MSNIIDKIQLSGITYDIGGGSITIDPTLDSGSTNPVANSAITTALDEKVNVADNIVSAATINYAYDVGDTSYKYPYNNGLIINEFYVKPVNQYTYTNTAAWNNVYISNGSSYTSIYVNVDCSNYQITAVTSTTGENFTYAIEDGVLHVTLSEGYTVQTIKQSPVFQISYEKYTIESGQTADVINEDLIDTIQDIYDQVPKTYLTAVTPMLDSTRLTILNTKSDGTNSGKFISFGSSIKGDNNKLDAYLPSRYITNVTLNTGNSNYCQVPSSTVNDYNTGFAYMDLAVNTGYTGSSTSFTFTVKTLFNNNAVQTDTFTYDVANKTIGGNQLYISVYCYNNTITINPKQYNFSRIQSVSEPNCKICGVDSTFKNQNIITGVTAASYARQANTVINEIYSELNGKATTAYVNQSTSGKVDTSVYTAYTAATDTALAGKQTTLTAGTGISIVDNVISATGGGGGKAIEAGRGITVTTGATADTVSFNLPISAGTGSYSIVEGYGTTASGNYGSHAEGDGSVASGQSSHAEGVMSSANGNYSHAEGVSTTASGSQSHAEGSSTEANGVASHAEGQGTIASGGRSHAEGWGTTANADYSHTEGYGTVANNQSEHASGQFNVSNSASTTFCDSGNTLFSVGNGTGDNARHNAFEIRQNGDIYLSSGGTDIKLQDHLGGGGSVTVDTELDSGSTNPVQNKVIYNKIDEVEEVTAAGLNALNDKITPTVELTQAEYDALVDKDPNTYYIITDATAVDLTNYYTKSETNTLLGGKQATLVSGTNIKTINNESILGSGNIDIQGGSTYTAGRGISIANDTISFDLPIYKTVSGTAHSLVLNTSSEPSANIFKTKYNTYINCINPYVDNNSGTRNLIMGEACSAMSYASESFVGGFHTKIGDNRTFAFGAYSEALAVGAVAFGYDGQSFKPQVSKGNGSFACGGGTSANTQYSFATGYHTFTTRRSEFASGQYNNSVSASTTFGDSGNTLFSVGNGTSVNARHNAFEIRQNGDIYLTKDGQDVKLQDQLGGGTVDQTIISGSTNAVAGGAVYNKIDEVEQVTAAGLNALNDNFGGLKLVKLTQAEYNALATKDSSTLYIIVN